MPSSSQDRNFADHLLNDVSTEAAVGAAALDNAIEWIASNLDPDDVFSQKDLEAWAENNGYKKGYCRNISPSKPTTFTEILR